MLDHPNYEFKNDRKGYKGSVLIIGGSDLYVGAPYSTAISALYTGADIVYIFSGEGAIIPLKGLIPEAIVGSIKYQEWILKRVNVCVFGPGLGNIDKNKEEIKKILRFLNENKVFIIIDGDGIRNMEELEIENYENIIYTPNYNEAKRIKPLKNKQYAFFKGEKDKIVSYDGTIREIEVKPCGKRCGGQGDLICGILASLLIKSKEITSVSVINSMCLTSKIIRGAGVKAFEKRGFSTIQRDIKKEIPEVFNEIMFIRKLIN